MDLDLETVKARVEADGEHVKKQERAFVLYAQRWWDEVGSACMRAMVCERSVTHTCSRPEVTQTSAASLDHIVHWHPSCT